MPRTGKARAGVRNYEADAHAERYYDRLPRELVGVAQNKYPSNCAVIDT